MNSIKKLNVIYSTEKLDIKIVRIIEVFITLPWYMDAWIHATEEQSWRTSNFYIYGGCSSMVIKGNIMSKLTNRKTLTYSDKHKSEIS